MDNKTKTEVLNFFREPSKFFDDICIACRGRTWEEHEQLLLGKKEADHDTNSNTGGRQ